jgi:hypothetical protein
MNNTFDFISHLSREAKPIEPLKTPQYWSIRLLAVIVVYATASQMFLGLRPDLWMQLTRTFFAIELSRLENAVSQLTDPPETAPLQPEHLSSMTPDLLMESKLYPRKALELFAFDYPVNVFFSM